MSTPGAPYRHIWSAKETFSERRPQGTCGQPHREARSPPTRNNGRHSQDRNPENAASKEAHRKVNVVDAKPASSHR
jgi:hypothetical protein